jgi:spermidine/putrescine transport system permease protein
MNRNRILNVTLTIYVGLIFAFVFAPIIFSLIFSFNSQRFPTIPLGCFSTEWFVKILNDSDIWEAARNSLIVSCSTAVIATFLGFCTAYSDFRYNFRFKGPYLALILLPPTIPLIIMALAMLAWFSKIGASGQLYSIVIAHSVLTAPFAMAVIRLRLNQMDADLESAAWNLGASEWATMRHVIIPFCKPAIISGLFLTAAVSFDEFAVAWFVSGLNKTLPVVVLEIVQGNIDPQVNAIGTFVFLISMTLVVLAQLFFASRQLKSIRS